MSLQLRGTKKNSFILFTHYIETRANYIATARKKYANFQYSGAHNIALLGYTFSQRQYKYFKRSCTLMKIK